MTDFVAIDVETANAHRTSICAVGAVKVRGGVITDTFYRLVRPVPNYYLRRFTDDIHGLSRKDTDSAPTLDTVWQELRPWIGHLPLVAHNSAFDSTCLRHTLRYYGITDLDSHPFHCTLRQARRTIPRQLCTSFSLPSLAQFLGISFDNHHNALADAEACAKIAMTLL
ncbi:MAG: 3'-5' exonuclease [bacterium]|nr:3'-5' exonuclease [bacterium]